MKCLLFLFCVFLPGLVRATPGTVSVPFLRVSVAARPAAMGGAFVAVADDANAVFWNPAGLGQQTEFGLSFTRLIYYESTSLDQLGMVIPMGTGFSLGVSGFSVNYGSILYGVEASDGSYDESASDALGSFTSNGLSAGVGAGLAVIPGLLYVGAQGKFVQETLETVSESGIMVDAGVLLVLKMGGLLEAISVGGVIQNLGSFGEGGKSPQNMKGGAALRLGLMKASDTILSVEVNMPSELSVMLMNAGGEIRVAEMVSLRAGIKTGGDLTGMTFGGGVQFKLNEITYFIDYAMETVGDATFGATHRISIRALFSAGE